jgi:glycosyltransferase involved in cell wall biosynthesis
MAMARPVVATAIGPSAELLGADAGCLVPPRADALASAIADILDAPQIAIRMGAAGRARVEACFSLERQVAQMQRLYAEVVASG